MSADTMVRERPILFSAPMVRALLDGTKTQTRRVVTTPLPHGPFECHWNEQGWAPALDNDGRPRGCSCKPLRPFYGLPGDRLWVRETWQYADWTEDGEPFVRHAADDAVRFCEGAGEGESLVDVWSSLSEPTNYAIDGKAADRRWRPSIFMPRWACRIVLELTDARVQRVQDISEDDARAEGAERQFRTVIPMDGKPVGVSKPYSMPDSHRAGFANLWSRLNGPRGYGWDTNPWVWALTFRRIDA